MTASRRQVLAGGAAAGVCAALPAAAAATPQTMAAAIKDFTGGKLATPGRVVLEIPALVENGNSVPLKIRFDSPMTEADHVKTFALFSQKNPESNIGRFHLGPRAGRAEVSTRIRLADSQKLTAIAELSDGSYWSGEADLIVTLPACVEE